MSLSTSNTTTIATASPASSASVDSALTTKSAVALASQKRVPTEPLNNSGKEHKWVQAYERFLLQNAGRVSSVESTIRSFSYLITGQVQEVEIASETLYSVLQILGLYHDKIISKATKPLLATDPLYRPNNHNRYTGNYMKTNGAYRKIVLFLTLIRCTELLWEMIARRKFKERGRWLAVIAIEALKASCRIGLLVSSKARPVISPPLPEREIDPNRIVCDDKGVLSLLPVVAGQDPNTLELAQKQEIILAHGASSWEMPRSGMGLPRNPENSVDQFLAQKVLAAEDVRTPEYLLHQLGKKGIAAESLYILRPVIYAVLAYSYRHNRRNWTPWVAGVLLEYGSRKLAFSSYKQSLPGGFRSFTKLEDEEHKNRAMGFGWWLMRGAMYENCTRPVLSGVLSKVNKVPVAGTLIGAVVEDYMYLFDNYHFPSSTL